MIRMWTSTRAQTIAAVLLLAACAPEPEDAVPSPQEAEAMVHELNAAWNAQDGDAIERLFAAQAVHEDVTSGRVSRGAPAIRELFESTWDALPDGTTEVVRVMPHGEQVVWEWTMTATHTGDFPNLPATGRHFTLPGVSIIRIGDGKILSQRDYYDQATFLRQVGALPEGL